MGQQTNRNRRWVLASRPHGAPVPENFRLEEDEVASRAKARFCCALFIFPLDPYMRGRMSDEPSYSPPVEVGGVMVRWYRKSRGVIPPIRTTSQGEWVLSYSGWQDYDISGRKRTGEAAALIPNIPPGRWVLWVCRGLPLIWACWISVSRKRGNAGGSRRNRAGWRNGWADR